MSKEFDRFEIELKRRISAYPPKTVQAKVLEEILQAVRNTQLQTRLDNEQPASLREKVSRDAGL